MAKVEWVRVKNVWRSKDRVDVGVWKRRDGGHVIEGKALSPLTGKDKEVFRVLPDADAKTARIVLLQELARIRAGAAGEPEAAKTSFKEFAASHFETQVKRGEIKSAATRERWESEFRLHIFKAPFASFLVDKIKRVHIQDWIDGDRVTGLVHSGKYSPHYANGWIRQVKAIVNAYVEKFQLSTNPAIGLRELPTSGRSSITHEQPNSLTADELPIFLAELRTRYPQHFAFSYLGFVCGFRPSVMRPLRREGESADVLWGQRIILVRRSQTKGDEVMLTTKTDDHFTIGVPQEVMDVLEWHVDRLPHRVKMKSDLLFPALRSRRKGECSGFMSPSFLTIPFNEVADACGIKKHLSAKAMRRTAEDLQRATQMHSAVRAAVGGHQTEKARKLYETITSDETRKELAKVVSLIDWRHATARKRAVGT